MTLIGPMKRISQGWLLFSKYYFSEMSLMQAAKAW